MSKCQKPGSINQKFLKVPICQTLFSKIIPLFFQTLCAHHCGLRGLLREQDPVGGLLPVVGRGAVHAGQHGQHGAGGAGVLRGGARALQQGVNHLDLEGA